jgi:hypothetical protein
MVPSKQEAANHFLLKFMTFRSLIIAQNEAKLKKVGAGEWSCQVPVG